MGPAFRKEIFSKIDTGMAVHIAEKDGKREANCNFTYFWILY
jgi:hypothetical protein